MTAMQRPSDFSVADILFDPDYNNDEFHDKKPTDCPPQKRGEEEYLPPCGWKQRGINLKSMLGRSVPSLMTLR